MLSRIAVQIRHCINMSVYQHLHTSSVLAATLVIPVDCSFKDKEVQRDAKMVSYDVVDKMGKPYVQVEVSGEKKSFSPEEISAFILGKMKETAGESLNNACLL